MHTSHVTSFLCRLKNTTLLLIPVTCLCQKVCCCAKTIFTLNVAPRTTNMPVDLDFPIIAHVWRHVATNTKNIILQEINALCQNFKGCAKMYYQQECRAFFPDDDGALSCLLVCSLSLNIDDQTSPPPCL